MPFEPGQVVWAKLAHWPHWPGKVVKLADVPAAIKKELLKSGPPAQQLVVYFFQSNNYGLVSEALTVGWKEGVEKFANEKDKKKGSKSPSRSMQDAIEEAQYWLEHGKPKPGSALDDEDESEESGSGSDSTNEPPPQKKRGRPKKSFKDQDNSRQKESDDESNTKKKNADSDDESSKESKKKKDEEKTRSDEPDKDTKTSSPQREKDKSTPKRKPEEEKKKDERPREDSKKEEKSKDKSKSTADVKDVKKPSTPRDSREHDKENRDKSDKKSKDREKDKERDRKERDREREKEREREREKDREDRKRESESPNQHHNNNKSTPKKESQEQNREKERFDKKRRFNIQDTDINNVPDSKKLRPQTKEIETTNASALKEEPSDSATVEPNQAQSPAEDMNTESSSDNKQKKKLTAGTIGNHIKRICKHAIPKYLNFSVTNHSEAGVTVKAKFPDRQATNFEVNFSISTLYYLMDMTCYCACLYHLHQDENAVTTAFNAAVVNSDIPMSAECTVKAKIIHSRDSMFFLDGEVMIGSKLILKCTVTKSVAVCPQQSLFPQTPQAAPNSPNLQTPIQTPLKTND